MTSDSTSHPPQPQILEQDLPRLPPAPELQVWFKSEEDKLCLFLPPDTETDQPTEAKPLSWTEVWQQLKYRIQGEQHNWQPQTEVHLIANNRLLDGRQLQEVAQALAEVNLDLKRVQTSRRQTAVTAATAGYSVDQDLEQMPLTQAKKDAEKTLADPLYLQMTLRSGVEIRHPSSVIILGDVNPGSLVAAQGDIIVWGRLRGSVHAGSDGNDQSMVMALRMEPTLIRIADKVARGPETPPTQFYPEVAYITPEGIRISRASDLAKMKRRQP